MKINFRFTNFVQLLFLFAAINFSAGQALPQSGQTDKSNEPVIAPVQPADEPVKNEEDVSKLELYEYIEPKLIKTFVRRLNELGTKKYRLKDLTQTPFNGESSNVLAAGSKFAGVVRLDETKYEYKFIEVEATADVAAALNRESKDGFNFCEIISYESAATPEQEDDLLPAALRNQLPSPQLHNLILLERETGKAMVPREFQLLKAGFGISKNPTEKMQALLDESAKQNFYPLGAFMSYGIAGREKGFWRLVDNYYGAILEKSTDDQITQIQFVRASLQSTFKKRANKLASDGFKMGRVGFLHGLMYKSEENSAAPTTYQWINANAKTFADELLKLSNAGAKFYGTSLRMSVLTGVITESEIVFEQLPAADRTRYEYEILRMVEETPQPLLIAKTIVPPDEPIRKFRRFLKQGYAFAGLIYADQEIVALFERRRGSEIK